MKKLFSGLFLFLISGMAFADSAWNVSGGVTPVASHTDLSVAYLAQVFGTVGDTLQGTSGQMLGMLFSKLNEGIMVVAGLWLIYTVITIILRSAMDGSFMGPNKNVFWIVIRIALAFAMLIPGPMTGYNVIQDIVMKVVVEGVSLADQTWNFGLDYIAAGGTLWRSPNATGDGTAVVSQKAANTLLKGMQPIFKAEVCMYASSIQNANNQNNPSGSGVANRGSSPVVYNIVEGQGAYSFPGFGNNKNYASKIQNDPPLARCGFVKWRNILSATTSKGTTQLAKAALSQVVYGLLPAAKKYACANYPGGAGSSVCSGVATSTSTVIPDNQNSVFNALVNYVNGVYPVAQSAHQSAAKLAMNWFSNAEKTGWMMAGRYYWDLSQVQAYKKQVSDIGSYAPPSSNITPTIKTRITNPVLKNFIATTESTWELYEDGNNTYPNGALKQLARYSEASNAGHNGNQHPGFERNFGNKILDVLLGGIVGDMVSLITLFSTKAGVMGMGPDPIVFLHDVGMKCMAIAGDIWIGLAEAIFGLSIVTVLCQGSVNASTPMTSVSNWIKTPLMVLATALLGVGVLLGYYVPLYPFMLFTFGVIGWLISVIEAMVAGPLIAFGLTHPEGHDFLGEAKQGLMLLLGVFLRPVLMIIGLIAGMILSYVSLRILVYTYSGFLQDIFYQVAPIPGASGSVLISALAATGNIFAGSGVSEGAVMMDLFAFPLFLVVFAALVYVVTNQCFSLIYVLPDYILRWIGGPQTSAGSNPAEMARQVQGAMGQMANTTGDAASKGIEGKSADNKEKEQSKQTQQGTTTQHDVQ